MLSGARSSLRIAVNRIGFEMAEMDDEIDRQIAECKFLVADSDRLIALAKRSILQREAREARAERRRACVVHNWLVQIALFVLKVMVGFCNVLLFLPFDDDE
jgi:hypothetical protein